MEKENKETNILKAVFNIISSIGSELDLEIVCKQIVKKIYQITDCNGCAIILVDGSEVSLQSSYGFGGRLDDENLIDSPIIKYVLKNKKNLIIGDAKNSLFSKNLPFYDEPNSIICMPIFLKGRVSGIIYIDSRQLNAFTSRHEYFLNILAYMVSVSIERSINYEKIKRLTITDELTQVFNRRKFDIDIHDETNKAVRYVRNLSLLMVDIDHFKKFNDTYGHQTGDEILKAISNFLTSNKRITDKVYRYGGEEFAMLCTETDKESATIFAERLCKSIAGNNFGVGDGVKKITVSIGVGNFPFDAFNKEELIAFADKALYRAKDLGRNRISSVL